MRLVDVHARLLQIGSPVFQTSDAAAHLKIRNDHVSQMLRRLASAGHLVNLRRGVWAIAGRIDRLALPAILTAPFPSYISMQTALYYHGMVSQIPTVIYAATIGRTRRFTTPLGTVSAHHLQPSFFFGFEAVGDQGVQIATPEKALLDILYLRPSKSKLFRAMPELELPSKFRIAEARRMIRRVPSQRRRLVSQVFEALLRNRDSAD